MEEFTIITREGSNSRRQENCRGEPPLGNPPQRGPLTWRTVRGPSIAPPSAAALLRTRAPPRGGGGQARAPRPPPARAPGSGSRASRPPARRPRAPAGPACAPCALWRQVRTPAFGGLLRRYGIECDSLEASPYQGSG